MLNQFVLALVAALAMTTQVWAEEVRYRLDLHISWSAETYPCEFPPSAHLTRFIGATHHSR
jgi:hypothetical protein